MLLLDTCTFIWLTGAPGQLSPTAQRAIDEASELYVSDVSIWEICLKWQARKLRLPTPPRRWITEQLGVWALGRLRIESEDLFRSAELPDLHKDPFDRLLVAQALVHNARLVTPDPAIHSYPVAVLW